MFFRNHNGSKLDRWQSSADIAHFSRASGTNQTLSLLDVLDNPSEPSHHRVHMKAVLLLLLSCVLAQAQSLEWEATEATVKMETSKNTVSAVYRFQNISDQSVEIKDVRTSCGCTGAKFEKKTYAPGDKGEITVTYKTPWGARGRQVKPLIVKTSAEPTLLKLIVELPGIGK